MRLMMSLALCLVIGCGVTAQTGDQTTKPKVENKPQAVFDAAAAADEFANQAKLLADDPLNSSEVLDGMLNIAVECGMDAEFVGRIRKAAKTIGHVPPMDIPQEEIDAIRAVR